MTDTCESDEGCDFEIELEGTTFTILTKMVRNQYFKFLMKQLENNVRTCWDEDKLKDGNHQLQELIRKCTQNLEDLAIKEATLTQLYQRAIVKTINRIRHCTQECRLLEEMQLIINSNEWENKIATKQKCDKAVQTEKSSAQTLTLDERIKLFQNDEPITINKKSYNSTIGQQNCLVEGERNFCTIKRKRSSHTSCPINETKKVWHSPTPPPLPEKEKIHTISKIRAKEAYDDLLENDEVAEELEKLFMEQETNLEEVFGISLKNKHTNYDETTELPLQVTIEKTPDQIKTFNENTNTHNIATENSQLYCQPVHDLRHSLWPAECFMQKRRLSATLNRLVEEDIRWFDIIEMHFSLLFGDYGDIKDDFASCSPSLELDEVITSSCMRRISPWVVRYLMKPLQDGLIGNRFLFKKLAKKLAYHITTENQYPNEFVIKTAVENFFCLHRAVMTAEDLNDVDMIGIASSEVV